MPYGNLRFEKNWHLCCGKCGYGLAHLAIEYRGYCAKAGSNLGFCCVAELSVAVFFTRDDLGIGNPLILSHEYSGCFFCR